MSKILKSFGMAALLVALLAGTGMADVGPITVDGCVIPADHIALTEGTVDDLDLGVLPTLVAGTAGGSLGVVAGNNYTVTVADGGAGVTAGKMAQAEGANPLTNAFKVKSGLTTATLAGAASPQGLATGARNTVCDPQAIEVIYIQDNVTGGVAGAYSIKVTFAASLNA